MGAFTKGWYLVYTRPKNERKLCGFLAEHQLEHLLPTCKVLRQWSDRRKYIETPLFPSYVFVHLCSMEQYYLVLNHETALYYVRNGHKTAVIGNTVIQHIRTIVQSGLPVNVSTAHFQAGERIQVREGPFAGSVCEVVEYRNEMKVIVRLELIGRCLLATFNGSLLQHYIPGTVPANIRNITPNGKVA